MNIVTGLVALAVSVVVGLLLWKCDRSRPVRHKEVPEQSGISGFAGDGGEQ